MSSPAPAPAPLLLLVVAPLDGAGGYLRWKESVLLRLRTLGVAYVLSERRPDLQAGDAAEKWAHADELCRGHILAALSDRLLPDYAHHATAAAVWRALARTYDLDLSSVSSLMFSEYKFVDGAPVLEQLAHVEALAAISSRHNATTVSDLVMAKFPSYLADAIILASPPYQDPPCMDDIWNAARLEEECKMSADIRQRRREEDEQRRQKNKMEVEATPMIAGAR